MKATEIDPLTLSTLNDHPRVRAANARHDEATAAQQGAQRRHADALARLDEAERDAADGRRDDARLRQARSAVDSIGSEARIAALALARRQEERAEAIMATAAELTAVLRAEHVGAIKALDHALAEARRCSDAVARLEEHSLTLFPGGRYNPGPGQPLPQVAWYREFGGPSARNRTDTRYETWRECCGVPLDD